MIISASRRTDIPAFFGPWFMNRVRAGYCLVPNPYNAKQVSKLGLGPDAVDAFVFWTKNPGPFLKCLPELDERGYRYYFLFTLNDYPSELEPGLAGVEERAAVFARLSERLGSERVIWRYDPIIISNFTDSGYHEDRFAALAKRLAGHTGRVIVSLMEPYQKTRRNLKQLVEQGWVFDWATKEDPKSLEILAKLAGIARAAGMEMRVCADGRDMGVAGLKPSACVDAGLINSLWGLGLAEIKDPGQRGACGCAPSRDIGMTNSCLHGCLYCYATASPQAAMKNRARHDPDSPVLLVPA